MWGQGGGGWGSQLVVSSSSRYLPSSVSGVVGSPNMEQPPHGCLSALHHLFVQEEMERGLVLGTGGSTQRGCQRRSVAGMGKGTLRVLLYPSPAARDTVTASTEWVSERPRGFNTTGTTGADDGTLGSGLGGLSLSLIPVYSNERVK